MATRHEHTKEFSVPAVYPLLARPYPFPIPPTGEQRAKKTKGGPHNSRPTLMFHDPRLARKALDEKNRGMHPRRQRRCERDRRVSVIAVCGGVGNAEPAESDGTWQRRKRRDDNMVSRLVVHAYGSHLLYGRRESERYPIRHGMANAPVVPTDTRHTVPPSPYVSVRHRSSCATGITRVVQAR